ncbi:MAG: hypothetical protein NC177_03090 [Ruminococcus flavefaciens]|nr:hypothetical protein [Ruminococcus flavefaciens]
MEQNGVRYKLDFMFMPLLAEDNGIELVNAIIESHGGILCDIFNSYYDEFGNKLFFKDNPKHFIEEQFTVTEKVFDDETNIIHISLPEEHTGSFVYCTAYVFVCGMKDDSCSMYTIEKSMGDITFIGKMSNGNHMNLGFATGSVDGDIQRIRDLTYNE